MLHYDPPDGSYTSRIPSGTQALREYIEDRFGVTTQVVRDKDRCEGQDSEHCTARAIDGFTASKAKRRAMFDWTVANADRLQLQSVIADRRVWGFGKWSERHYDGPSPHTDHTHVGLTKWASKNLTRAMFEEDDMPDEATFKKWVREVLDEDPLTIKKGWRAQVWKALFKKRPGSSPAIYDEHLDVIEKKIP